MQRTLAQATFWILVVSSSHASRTNYRTLIALLEKESRDLARDRVVLLSLKAGLRAIEIFGLTWAAFARMIR
jgi:hypothetical protein